MKEKLSPKRVSLSLGIVVGILSLVCALLLAIFPEGTLKLFGSIFHGIDITQIAIPITLNGAILGTIVVTILALIIGWLYAIIYNKFN